MAMLQQKGASVCLCLRRAATARDYALMAADPDERQFYRAMECRWMDLAISTAIVEGVDSLVRTKDFRSHLPASNICLNCLQRMPIKIGREIDALGALTFQCDNCSSERK
jgi:hypothetical protein